MNRLHRAVSQAGVPIALASLALLNVAFFTDSGNRLLKLHQEAQAASNTQQLPGPVNLFGGAEASLKTSNMDLLDVALIEADPAHQSKWATIRAAVDHLSPAEQERKLEELAGVDQEWAHIKTIQKGIEAQEDTWRQRTADNEQSEKRAGPGGLKPRVTIVLKPDYSLQIKEESPKDFASRMKMAFSETTSTTPRVR